MNKKLNKCPLNTKSSVNSMNIAVLQQVNGLASRQTSENCNMERNE